MPAASLILPLARSSTFSPSLLVAALPDDFEALISDSTEPPSAGSTAADLEASAHSCRLAPVVRLGEAGQRLMALHGVVHQRAGIGTPGDGIV